ncbi:MAG: multiprotein bridging factor aMBF1 [Nanoarchaeota archaeon]|nr:multiprotein bridging factor aMBF1 [Nanoarchaeota archaeon]
MAVCDMCGSAGHLVKAKVEGSLITVCEKCARFGQVQEAPQQGSFRPRPAQQFSVPNESVVGNYATLIKSKREQLGLNQEDFAKQLNEKASFMHAIESGHHEPPVPLAKKLEKLLKIRLVEQDEKEEESKVKVEKPQGFTMADFIKK